MLPHLQLRQASLGRQLPAGGHIHGALLQRQHPPLRSHAPSQVLGHEAGPGPQIQHPLALPQAGAIQSRLHTGLPERVLNAQAIQFLGVGAEHVVAC